MRPVAPRPIAAETASHSERLADLREDLVRRAREVAPAVTPAQFFSHSTGLALLGAPLPFRRDGAHPLHLSVRRPAPQPRRTGVVGHRLQDRPGGRWIADGLPIDHPARLWRQAAGGWDVDDIIAAGDFLICPRHRLITLDDLWDEVRVVGDVSGRKLHRALDEIRAGAETAEETRLRLAITRAGLPEPALNHDLRTDAGRFVARLDLAYPRYRVGVEHDGRVHAFDEKQFARDADRWDDIRREGWTHVRILSHHLRPDPARAVQKVAEALLAAGWRGHGV